MIATFAVVSVLALPFLQEPDGLKDQIRELQAKADDAEPELVHKIADARNRVAMEGLLAAYDSMASILMRREIVRALAVFDEVPQAAQPALEKVAEIAMSAPEPELRDAAFTTLGEAKKLGKHFLREIVKSRANDLIRERALKTHVKRGKEADAKFYRYIWNPDRDRRKDDDGNVIGELEGIRELAFKGVSKYLNEQQLVDTMRDEFNPKIRRAALDVLARRSGSGKTAEMARWMLERVNFPGQDRVVAARVLARLEGPNCVKLFLKLAKKRDVTTEDLREAMAELIVEMNDEAVNKKLVKMVGRGKPHLKVFALAATRHIDDPKLIKKIRKGLTDRDFAVRCASAHALAERRDKRSLPELEKMLAEPQTPADIRVAIEAISVLRKRSKAWRVKLSELLQHEERDVRNAALEQVWERDDSKTVPELTAALSHADWTTRLLAIRACEGLRHKELIPVLIGRLEVEDGRLQRAVADTLWRLSGRPFGKDSSRWQSWWAGEGEAFTVISSGDLALANNERELRRLQARTTTETEFFGIRIESHRVIFVIDTSGSMTAPVLGEYVGKRGATRLDIAKRELSQAIEGLQSNALFNILSFSTGIGYFIKGDIADVTEVTRESALEFVKRLGAGGATNLFDTMKVAFDDQDVDTIFVLSDGEPSAGEFTDPHRIRQRVAFWNEHRRVKIHTISIGGNLEVLEWLAADSGGDHVRIR